MFSMADKLTMQKTRKTKDGYLVADVRAARTGIQRYLGSEVGLPDREFVDVYRPAEEVFHKDAMASYAYKPVTNDHPADLVTADTWRADSVGTTGNEIARDGEFINIPMSVMDASTIQDIESGKKELSAGYTCDLDFVSGVTTDGKSYDAVQRNIRINHLAVVQKGRAGPACSIGDKTQPKQETINVALRTIQVDGLPVETTDAGAQALAKRDQQLIDLQTAADTAQATHDAALAARDTDLAKKDSEIAELKKQVVSGDALDALVTARADIVSKASSIIGDGFASKGKSNQDLKKEAVTKDRGADFVADKSEAYIDAAFDLLTVDTTDNVARALMQPAKAVDGSKAKFADTAEGAHAEMCANLSSQWEN